jgi:hypothetical protein
MEAIFEAKYISIEWYDKNTIFKIVEAILPISVEVENNTTYSVELEIYPQVKNGLFGQVAFHLLDVESRIEPYFLNASNTKISLLKIIDPKTNKIWWIENGKVKKKEKKFYIQSTLFNHPGETKVKFDDIQCNINIRANSFTKEQLDLYLSDFRNDFWYLILQNNSLTQGDAKNKKVKLLDNETTKFISEFIKYSEKVLLNPKKELREIQSLKDIKRVKPVARTFMEIATSGFRKKLTSRDTVESYNVAENKYIHYVIQQVYTIIFNILNATGYIKDLNARKSKSDSERLNNFTDFKTIDKEVFENEVLDLERLVREETSSLFTCIRKQDKPINISMYKKETVIVQLGNKTKNQNKLEFFGNMKNNANDIWVNFKDKKYKDTKYENSFFMISFDKDFFDEKLKKDYEYEVTGYIKSKNKEDRGDKKGIKYQREFLFISNIKILKSKTEKNLENLKNQKPNLEKSNWQRKLSPQERQEQEYEKQALKENLDRLKDKQSDNLELIKSLEPSLNKLKKLLLQCKKLKIKQDSYFPNSMTFVQNPNYQGSHNYFKKIKDIVGIDESLFIQMQLVEKIGLLDIPTIYERWCFLQIIKVLIDKYHFIPEKDWKTKLAHQAIGNLNNLKNIKISFFNTEIAREIDLCYEKELPNRKRPDFILDIKSTFDTKKTHRLVMDAKFHERVDIKKQIDLLYHQKDYSEGNQNTVFILHPDANKSIKKKETPKEWGNDAYYGEVEMFNFPWDTDSKPNHKYGAILLSPIGRNGNFLDNLQRLIGMSMQYKMENNKDCSDPEPKEKIFCLVCGDNNFCGNKNPTKNNKGYRYTFSCKKCKHHYMYNYCWSCKNRLIKNGRYWSYHSSKALEEFNIECPQCSAFLLLD